MPRVFTRMRSPGKGLARLLVGVLFALGVQGCESATEPQLTVQIVAPDLITASGELTALSVSVVNVGSEPVGIESCNAVPTIRIDFRFRGIWSDLDLELICGPGNAYHTLQPQASYSTELRVLAFGEQIRLTVRLSDGRSVSHIVNIE